MSNASDLSVPKEQEAVENDKPPSNLPRPALPWRVAVIANVKGESSLPIDAPADAGAEFDRKETIEAILRSIESDGHSAVLLPADSNLPYALHEIHPDIEIIELSCKTGEGLERWISWLKRRVARSLL